MPRLLEPELLDDLAPADPIAQGARKDLRLLNALMGHARLIERELPRPGEPIRICDLGGGDGSLMPAIANGTRRGGVEVTIVDRVRIVSEQTQRALAGHGWRLQVVESDVETFLRDAPNCFDVITANLFLHHFDDESLRRLFVLAARRCSTFVACEPRRSVLAAIASRCVGFIGCNRVTRHDAMKSVQAGFSGKEITGIWPKEGWMTIERGAGLFSHLFTARRKWM